MSMETFHTLTQLLDNAGCRYNIFDLGRRVNEIEISNLKRLKKIASLIHGHYSNMHTLQFHFGNTSNRLGCGFYAYPLMNVGY